MVSLEWGHVIHEPKPEKGTGQNREVCLMLGWSLWLTVILVTPVLIPSLDQRMRRHYAKGEEEMEKA